MTSKKTVTKPVNSAVSNRTTDGNAPVMPSRLTSKQPTNKGTTKEAFDREMARMKEENAKALERNKDLMDEISELKEENCQLTKRFDEAIKERSAAESALAEVREVSDKRIAETQETADARVAEAKETADAEIAKAKETADAEIAKAKEEFDNKLDDLAKKLEVANNTIERKDIQLADINGKCEKQAKTLAEKQVELSDATEKIRELETKVSQLKTSSIILGIFAILAAILFTASLM